MPSLLKSAGLDTLAFRLIKPVGVGGDGTDGAAGSRTEELIDKDAAPSVGHEHERSAMPQLIHLGRVSSHFEATIRQNVSHACSGISRPARCPRAAPDK